MQNSVFTKRKLLWITLAKQLQANNIPVDSVQCENKWKALCRAYRNHYKSFQYREIVERILSLNDSSTVLYIDKESGNSLGEGQNGEPSVKKALIEVDSLEAGTSQGPTKLWNDSEVNMLLEVYEQNMQDLSRMSKKRMYETLAQYLQGRGIYVNSLNVEHKWKGLLRAYKRRKVQEHRKTPTDIRVEKLWKQLVEQEEIHKEEIPIQIQAPNQMGLTEINYEYEGLDPLNPANPTHDPSNSMYTLINPENISFPIQTDEYEEIQEDNLSMHNTMSDTAGDFEISEETFEERLLRFLKEQEEAKQRRHAEKMELKRKKIDLLEALVHSKTKD